jgi:hypothetical protein
MTAIIALFVVVLTLMCLATSDVQAAAIPDAFAVTQRDIRNAPENGKPFRAACMLCLEYPQEQEFLGRWEVK